MRVTSVGEWAREAIEHIEAFLDYFDRIDERQISVSPQPRSDSAADEAACGVWNVSSLPVMEISAAIDHVRSFRQLVGQPPKGAAQYGASAPWPLLRSALETASTAVWLICEDDQLTRILRALRFYFDDARSHAKAESLLYPEKDRTRTMKVRLDALREVFLRSVPSFYGAANVKRIEAPLQITELVLAAAEQVKSIGPSPTLLTWQIASGYAHGRPWAWDETGARRIEVDADGREQHYSGVDFVTLARMLAIVTLTIEHADWLIRRRRGHEHAPLTPFVTMLTPQYGP